MTYTAEQDPLCYPGSTVLRNKADLNEQSALDEFETAMFALRASEPWPSGELSPAYYMALHRHFFQDVYAWAGQTRTIRIAKGGNWFCYPEYIERELALLFETANRQAWFAKLDTEPFVSSAAEFMADLNAIHPFRDGNGRPQLALLNIVTDLAGHSFDDEVLIPDRVLDAMISSFAGSNAKLESLIRDLIA